MTDAVTLQQEWMDTFNKLQQLSDELGVGDPFNYNRGREIHTAFTLGLTVSQTLSGADAYLNGKPVELKSTITKSIKATYNGISVQPTWDEQEDYLINDKIGQYDYHYFTRYEGSELVEAWRMDSNTVLSLLLSKLKKTYSSTLTRKDPRLSASLSKKEIEAYAERII